VNALHCAREYTRAGILVNRVKLDGTKAPAGEGWQNRGLFTEQELLKWFGRGEFGIGTVGGKVSGNLEIIDFDHRAAEVFAQWQDLVEAQCPGLVARLNVVQTPRAPCGYHVRYRCTAVEIPGNTKLAQEPEVDAQGRPVLDAKGKQKTVTTVETRGAGGMAIAPGSPPAVHQTGRPYLHVAGPPLTALADLTAEEREILWASARSFDRSAAGTAPPSAGKIPSGRVGDCFNQNGPPWEEILEGWQIAQKRGAVTYWRRPDKGGKGWSATTGYCTSKGGHDLLAVFSSNAAPFAGPAKGKPCSCYSKFSAYALLHHAGDFKAAAKALAAKGFGGKQASGGQGREQAPEGKPAAPSIRVGDLTLTLAGARKSDGGKVSAAVAVNRAGKQIDQLLITSAASGRRAAAKLLAAYLSKPDHVEVDSAIGQLIVAAARAAETQKPREGDPLSVIVARVVAEDFAPAFRTATGVYCEARGAEVKRQDLVSYVPSHLVDAAAEASNVPLTRQGDVLRPALLKALKAELEILYADLCRRLPLATGAELGEQSAAGREFRAALVRILTTPKTWEANVNGQAKRASLVSRAAAAIDANQSSVSRKWSRVLDACALWWRRILDADGELVPLVAIRWELAHQIGVLLPGVSDQDTFTTLGRRYGVIDPDPPILAKIRDGRVRLAVLTDSFVGPLLAAARDLDDSPDG
jgi:hypothetical protein